MYSDFSYPADNSDLPAPERDLAEVIGRSAAMRLSWRIWHLRPYRGGGSGRGVFYVPQRATPVFLALVGDDELADALIFAFRGERLELTGCRMAFKRLRMHAIRKLFVHGASKSDIAGAAGMSCRNVRVLCEGMETAEAWPPEVIARHLAELRAVSWMLRVDPFKFRESE